MTVLHKRCCDGVEEAYRERAACPVNHVVEHVDGSQRVAAVRRKVVANPPAGAEGFLCRRLVLRFPRPGRRRPFLGSRVFRLFDHRGIHFNGLNRLGLLFHDNLLLL